MPVAARPTGDQTADLFQRDVVALLNRLERLAILRDHTVKGVVLSPLENARVRHGLGAPPSGYFVVRRNAGCHVIEDTKDPEPETYILLTADGDVTVDLAFY